MKIIFFLFLISSQVQAFTVLNQRMWCSDSARCNGRIEVTQTFEPEVSKANIFLLNQEGYQGLEIQIGATHTFYLYNGAPAEVSHLLKASLCDIHKKCFFYEKWIRLKYGEFYSETVYSSVYLERTTIGAEKIFGDTIILYSPSDRQYAEAFLLVSPFPYDH